MTGNVSESLRDARQAVGEMAVSLELTRDKLVVARGARCLTDARVAIREATVELDAAIEYLALVRGEHRELGRILTNQKETA